MDIAAWLKNLGLGQYAAAFHDNAIDADLVPNLTADDLKELGVALVGHRRKLLDAIAALKPQPRLSPTRKAAAVERRPVTVMFCDLVGSTELAAKLDAEDWRDLVGAYFDAASATVVKYGGRVVQRLGDGLMALFGYPLAQENDPERAARAGLAVLAALEGLNGRNKERSLPRLAARIGLDMGPVVVDETGKVFGKTPNIAARAQEAADPGTVLVTAAVQLQIAGLFVVEDKGEHILKGVPGPAALYRLIRPSGARRRVSGRSLTPFVGREDDLALLLSRWERARGGEGQFIQIVGDPGLGKSRLIDEFRSRLGATPHSWVEWASSQLLQNTPLHPIPEWARLRFGGAEVPPETRLTELRSTLAQVKLDPDELAPVLAPLLDIAPNPSSDRLAPEELRRKQLAAVIAWILAGARAQPVVLVFEDLQWADPTSLALMRSLAERGTNAPLYLLATARPEFQPPWTMRSHHGIISLPPLDRAQIRAMVVAIAEGRALTSDVVDRVSDRTGGVPLFVEEVARLLLDGGGQAIPPTLEQSLAARLDRLGEAREVAQIGAVLGHEFSHRLLSTVASAASIQGESEETSPSRQSASGGAGFSEAALQSALDRLTEADLLYVEGQAPNAAYRFKHALIRDAAYESLLRSRRRALHRRAARALLAASDAQPEIVAHHLTQGGETDLAIEWWGKAGDAALRRSAYEEAIAHLGKAIEMADKEAQLPPGQRLKLQTDLGQAVMWSKGFAAEETTAALSRAGELAAQSMDGADSAVVRHAEFFRRFICGDGRLAHEIAEAFHRAAASGGRPVDRRVALRCLALSFLAQGRLELARGHARDSLSDDPSEDDAEGRRIFGIDHRVAATSYSAVASWLRGDLAEGRQLIICAVRDAQDTAHAATMVSAYSYWTLIEAVRGDSPAALLASQALIRVADQQQLPHYRSAAKMFSSWARGALSDGEAGLTGFRTALADYLEAGNRYGAPLAFALRADLEHRIGRLDEALASAEGGLSLATETGEHWSDSLLLRIKGRILLEGAQSDSAPAEATFRAAIEIARRQGARSLALPAALSLAKLCDSTGRSAEARAVLRNALEGFSPTPELIEIAEAQTLLSCLTRSRIGRKMG